MKIIKRDNTLEDFSTDNITRVVKAAGLKDNDAEALAKRVTDWVMSLGKDSVLSTDIRDKVQEELKKTNEDASNLYAWYQTTKE
jgi:transcriptional regulator NrdR family protein